MKVGFSEWSKPTPESIKKLANQLFVFLLLPVQATLVAHGAPAGWLLAADLAVILLRFLLLRMTGEDPKGEHNEPV